MRRRAVLLWLRPWRRGPALLLRRPGVAVAVAAATHDPAVADRVIRMRDGQITEVGS
jgi:hypothetical protein